MSRSKPIPKRINTVIVGAGPAALILSYILHGNCPFYDTSAGHHPDPILHSKLKADILGNTFDIQELTTHFQSSRFSYSTAALPVNVLLDTLLRPLADTEPGKYKSCISWRRIPERAVPHVVLGDTAPGGQWASNPVSASWDIGSLSYLDQLSLPGYSLREHLGQSWSAVDTDFIRPTRAQIADYLASYPTKVGIGDSIYPPSVVSNIVKSEHGFEIGSHSLSCKNLVLASGIFSNLLPSRPQLHCLVELPESSAAEPPLLVVGSGFSAADVIITNLPKRKIIHIFKWDPENRPSPLRACHKSAYPEYAGIYRQMKRAATEYARTDVAPLLERSRSYTLDLEAYKNYEGFPNTYINQASTGRGIGQVTLRLANGETVDRSISNLEYLIGRRGTLSYLSSELYQKIVGSEKETKSMGQISGKTLRLKVEEDLEVAPSIFVIGSLTGDSLIRHIYGSCVYVAQKIMSENKEGFFENKSLSLDHSTERPTRVINGLAKNPSPANGLQDSKNIGVAPKNDLELETLGAYRRGKRRWSKSGNCVML